MQELNGTVTEANSRSGTRGMYGNRVDKWRVEQLLRRRSIGQRSIYMTYSRQLNLLGGMDMGEPEESKTSYQLGSVELHGSCKSPRQ